MNTVWLLMHSYEQFGIGDDKILGIYSTPELAEAAKQRYLRQAGFRDYPEHCFSVQQYVLDTDDAWQEGFFRWGDSQTCHRKFIRLTEIINELFRKYDTVRAAWENPEYYDVLCGISWKLRHTETAQELADFIRRRMQSEDTERCSAIAEQLLNMWEEDDEQHDQKTEA